MKICLAHLGWRMGISDAAACFYYTHAHHLPLPTTYHHRLLPLYCREDVLHTHGCPMQLPLHPTPTVHATAPNALRTRHATHTAPRRTTRIPTTRSPSRHSQRLVPHLSSLRPPPPHLHRASRARCCTRAATRALATRWVSSALRLPPRTAFLPRCDCYKRARACRRRTSARRQRTTALPPAYAAGQRGFLRAQPLAWYATCTRSHSILFYLPYLHFHGTPHASLCLTAIHPTCLLASICRPSTFYRLLHLSRASPSVPYLLSRSRYRTLAHKPARATFHF